MAARTDPGEGGIGTSDRWDIEFIDEALSVDTGSETVVAGSRWSWLPVVLLIGAVWLVVTIGGDSAHRQGSALSSKRPPAIGATPANDMEPATRASWVVWRPGPQRLAGVDEALASTAIVYVDVRDRPVVVSFATGGVSEVDVSPSAVIERFDVIDASRALLGVDERTLTNATSIIAFHTTASAGGVRRLCPMREARPMEDEPCVDDDVRDFVRDGVAVELLEPGRHWHLAELLGNAVSSDGWLTVAEGFQIPAPASSTVWVIGPPERGGAAASIGRL